MVLVCIFCINDGPLLIQGYLDFEKTDGDPSRIQILYERAITEFPISTDLWLDYTRYLDKTLKVSLFLFLFHVFFPCVLFWV